jgi:hypothetical protein
MQAAKPALAIEQATTQFFIDPKARQRRSQEFTSYFGLTSSLSCRNGAASLEQHANGLTPIKCKTVINECGYLTAAVNRNVSIAFSGSSLIN